MSEDHLYRPPGAPARTWLEAALQMPDDRFVPDRRPGDPRTDAQLAAAEPAGDPRASQLIGLPDHIQPAAQYPPFAEAGRARCTVIPYLRPALDAATAELAAALAEGADVVVALPAGHQVALGPTLEVADRPLARPTAPRAKVYRAEGVWLWSCPVCDQGGTSCLHQVLHIPGTWRAAFCAGFHHIHRRHPRPAAREGAAEHTTMLGRRRCNWGRPDTRDQRLASWVLCGRQGMPHGDLPREIAREVLALAGQRTPG